MSEDNGEGRIVSQEPVGNWFQRQGFYINRWSEGKFWPFRAVLLLYFSYVGVRHLFDGDYTSLVGALNFGIHELGHVVIPGPRFLHMAAGTLFQLAAPVASFFMFRKQEDYFSMYSVCPVWLSTNLYYCAWYMSSATRPRSIQLLAPWANPKHDWHWILGKIHMLQYYRELTFMTRVFGFITMWGGIAMGVWVVWIMISPKTVKVSDL